VTADSSQVRPDQDLGDEMGVRVGDFDLPE
jgi:hypothetical protein